jgi:hypothetical protein
MYVHLPALAQWQAPSIALLTNMWLPPCRLTSLPPGVLWQIVRKMGRRSRNVSKAMLAAYGPLDCRLVLSGSAALADLWLVLGGSRGQRLQHVKSLQLPQLEQNAAACEADMVAAIVEKLPHLESLAVPIGLPDLSLLAPLGSTLTALDIHTPFHTCSAMGTGLSQLTQLRSLALSGMRPAGSDMVAWQHLLGSLPRLVQLSWYSQQDSWTAQWLAGLGSRMPRLTSLALGYTRMTQHSWDAGTTAALRQALVGLRALSMSVDPCTAGPMLEVLAQCTWLESLHLGLHLGRGAPPPDLQQLSSARLTSLDMRMCFVHAAPLVAALHALTHLTKLQLSYGCRPDSSAPQLPDSLIEVHLRDDWNPSSLLPSLQALPSLRVLHLHRGHDASWTPAAAEQLSKLTQLHAISFETCPHLRLPNLSALTALRELRMEAGHSSEHSVTDWDLLRLVPLQELTRLVLGQLQRVSASGLLALLEALPKLQQLELSGVLQSDEEVGGALVEGLLPRVLPRLRCLNLAGVPLPRHVRAALVSAAEAHDCRLL